jgi:hypothetical protein
MPRKAKSQVGLVLQVRPRGRWASPDVPEYDPNWIAEFRFPGRAPKRESTHLLVCEDCIADRRRNKTLNDSCGCRIQARRIAEERFLSLQTGWLTDKIKVQEWSRKHAEFSVGAVVNLFRETLTCARKPAEESDLLPFLERADVALSELLGQWKAQKMPTGMNRLSLRAVRQIYERCSLASRDDNLSALDLFYESVSGRATDDGFVDELDANWSRRFAALYQEYGRRGWAVRSKAPKDAWAQLRAMQPQPAIDWETPASWNTTIKSTLARVKAIFGGDSLEKYIHELANQMPDMRSFRECSLSLPTPDNRDAMTLEQFDGLLKALPDLRLKDERRWLVIQMAILAPLRSIELLAVQTHWLEVDGDNVLLIVKQRREEGFRLKDRDSKSEREIVLPADVVETIRRLAPNGGSIYGIEGNPLKLSKKGKWMLWGQFDKLYRRTNEWLREGGFVSDDSDQVLYVVGRKTGATVRARLHGEDVAGLALGHAKGSSVTRERYIEGRVRLDSVSTEETRSVLNKPRVPWVPSVTERLT